MTDPTAPNHGSGEPGDLVVGLHHIRLPVSDPWVSRDWYMTTLGCRPVLDEEEENEVVGVVLRHPQGLVIGLHRDPRRASSLSGFAIVGLTVDGRGQLRKLCDRLDQAGTPHSAPSEGHIGRYVDVPDPDGILIRFHTGTALGEEEA